MNKRRVINGVWYECVVVQGGEPRDVIVENSLHDAERRLDALAKKWPYCEVVYARKHVLDPQNGSGASKFHTLPKLTLDFRSDPERLRNNIYTSR